MGRTPDTAPQSPNPDELFNPASPLLLDFQRLETEPVEVLAYDRMLSVVHYLHAEEAGQIGVDAFFEAARRSQQPGMARRAQLTARAIAEARARDIADEAILEEAASVLAKLRNDARVQEAHELIGRSSNPQQ